MMRPTRTRRRPRESQPVSVFALVITVLLLIPICVVVGTSVNPGEFALFPPSGISFKWFSAAFHNGPFRSSFILSVEIAALTAAIGLVLAVPAALAVARGGRWLRRTVTAASAAPLVAPEILLGLGLLILFNSQLHFGSGVVAIVCGHLLVGIPLALQVSLAGLASVDPNLEQAAWTLGASKVKAFLRVSLPAVAPAIAGAAVFLFIFSFDNVSISLFLSSPGKVTLPIQMYQYLQYRADPTVAAMSTILVVIGVVAALVLGRLGALRHTTGAGGQR
jgi:putative spermidine/putrescine transport system permease protein